MKVKNCLIFGGSGHIGRNLIRKLTQNNYRVTVVTRNIHQKSYKIKTQANGYIDVIEASIFDEKKIRKLFEASDICINLVGILFEKKGGNSFKNIHSIFPGILAKLCNEYNIKSIITSNKCLTGTDRVAEVAKKIKCNFYINVQGDEPFFNPNDLRILIKEAVKKPNEVINCYTVIKNKK